ncbi:m7GpppX diphosphatase [Platysternon megacephalum]|uniref:M7GpppX diphosphatase n=1 Tax=Platysternon megacephalum TaxID=55544 RepID=A0A4D9DF12_9SAUR|nr:m7GpppX diphosphatase [Platysternon megacephalum]
MGVYKVRVATGNFLLAGTFSSISITLVGTHEESDKKPLDNCGKDFNPGAAIRKITSDGVSPTALDRGLILRRSLKRYSPERNGLPVHNRNRYCPNVMTIITAKKNPGQSTKAAKLKNFMVPPSRIHGYCVEVAL